MASRMNGNQASIGSKRFQNNGLSVSGDWICHTCGNFNFSFRLFCHKKYCDTPRPPSITPDAQLTNHPSQFNYGGVVSPSPRPRPLSQFNYGGVAIPPPLSPSPLYGMPIRVGLSIPHFGYPLPSITPGSFGGISYSPRPTINLYGYGIQGPPQSAAARITDNSASQKHPHNGPGILSKGNWICLKCMNVNYANRTKCNIKKCGAAKPKGSIPDGSWTCKKCGNINYPFRTKCNIKTCRFERSASSLSQIPSN